MLYAVDAEDQAVRVAIGALAKSAYRELAVETAEWAGRFMTGEAGFRR